MKRRDRAVALAPRVVALSIAVLMVVTACGSGQSAANRRSTPSATVTGAVVGGVQTVEIRVDQTFRFYPSRIVVHPGTVHIVLVHTGSGAPHDLQVVGLPGAYAPLVDPGERSQVTFRTPAPGTYRFECTIHVRQGQIGQLVVLSS